MRSLPRDAPCGDVVCELVLLPGDAAPDPDCRPVDVDVEEDEVLAEDAVDG